MGPDPHLAVFEHFGGAPDVRLAVVALADVAFCAAVEEVEGRVLAQFVQAEADSKFAVVFAALVQHCYGLEQTLSRGQAETEPVAVLIVVAKDCVGFAATGVTVGEEIATGSFKNLGYGWCHYTVE